jgi:hypothetical protein
MLPRYGEAVGEKVKFFTWSCMLGCKVECRKAIDCDRLFVMGFKTERCVRQFHAPQYKHTVLIISSLCSLVLYLA